MKVSSSQFWILSLLTVCAILWLLLLTCFRENWGFWQSPAKYYFLHQEYPRWLREYVLQYYSATLFFTVCLYTGWLILAYGRMQSSRVAGGLLVAVTLLFGLTLGVRGANNLIGYLDNGQLHGNVGIKPRP